MMICIVIVNTGDKTKWSDHFAAGGSQFKQKQFSFYFKFETSFGPYINLWAHFLWRNYVFRAKFLVIICTI